MINQEYVSEHPDSLSALMAHAEVLKNRNEYTKAKKIYERAMELSPNDSFLIQRMALVTYKSRLPDALSSLQQAQLILSGIIPDESNNPEILGLSGSINKKMYEESGDQKFLEKAIWFYKRGYYETRDYYNGINLAYLYTVKACLVENKAEACSCFENAVLVNKGVISICNTLRISTDFEERNDKEYIYQTLAQAYLGLDNTHEVIKLIPTINEVSKGAFDLDIFHEQNRKLIDSIVAFKKKYPDIKFKTSF